MRNIAVVPILNNKVVQTTKFSKPKYIGEPSNIVKQLSDMGADEIFVVDITHRHLGHSTMNKSFLRHIADQAFCPLGYGGSLYMDVDVEIASEIIKLGYEKIIAATAWWKSQDFYKKLSDKIGKQGVVKCIETDGEEIQTNDYEWVEQVLDEDDCGELMLLDITRNGTLDGLNPKLCEIAVKAPIPTSVCGGYNGKSSNVDTAASTYYMLYKGQVMLNYEHHHNATL